MFFSLGEVVGVEVSDVFFFGRGGRGGSFRCFANIQHSMLSAKFDEFTTQWHS